MRESTFQRNLIKKIKERFPGCIVLKNDPTYIQGIPDLTIFWGQNWATLECKASRNSPRRPNQEYYVDKMDRMSFSDFIYPENEEVILDAMEQAFEGRS